MQRKYIQQVKILLKKVIEAPISLHEFSDLCEDEWENDKYLKEVIDNIEDLLEHAPANRLSKGIDEDKYKYSKQYKIAILDLNLMSKLDLFADESELILNRKNELRKIQ